MSLTEWFLLPWLLLIFGGLFVGLVRLALRPTNRRLDHLIDLLEQRGPQGPGGATP